MEGMMKAWCVYDDGRAAEIKEIPIPTPGPGELLLKMASAGVCRTDVAIVRGKYKKFPLNPITPGHENAGWVVEKGPGTEDCGFDIGEAVVSSANTSCGLCPNCLNGNTNFCEVHRVRGFAQQGGMAQYMIVRPRELVSLGSLDPREWCSLGDAGLASYGPVRSSLYKLSGKSTILLFGSGALAGFAVQYCKLLTACTVIVVATADERIAMSRKKGADYVVKTGDGAYDEIMEITGGKGVDLVLDYKGDQWTMDLSQRVVKMNGRVSITAMYGGTFPLSWATMGTKTGCDVRLWRGGTMEDLQSVVSLAKRGKLINEHTDYPFEDFLKAIEDIENLRVHGRAIIRFDGLNY